MSKTGASPEFERKLQEIGAKSAHMVIPRSEVQRPITEPRYPAWPDGCDGSGRCQAPVHFHGCYSDFGACDDPTDHPKVSK